MRTLPDFQSGKRHFHNLGVNTMAANFKIKCEAIKVATDTGFCPGSAKCGVGEVYILGARTPEPGMCGRSFHTIHPMALAMQFTDKLLLEKPDGHVEVSCPGGFVVYQLSRIIEI